MNKLQKFRIGLRLANGQVLLDHVLDHSHEGVRARVDRAMALRGLPRATLLVCIPGGQP